MDKGYKKEDCSDNIANNDIYIMFINRYLTKDGVKKAQHVCNKIDF